MLLIYNVNLSYLKSAEFMSRNVIIIHTAIMARKIVLNLDRKTLSKIAISNFHDYKITEVVVKFHINLNLFSILIFNRT